jgi:hypothetical protein
MRWPNSKIVSGQFLFYVLGGMGGFAAWVMIQSSNESMMTEIVGTYLSYHFLQWTSRLYLWGPIVLVSAIIALAAIWFILKANRIGGYLGIISFLIGFAVDILVANVMFVHILVGLLIGWVLLSPVILGWDDLFSISKGES